MAGGFELISLARLSCCVLFQTKLGLHPLKVPVGFGAVRRGSRVPGSLEIL